MIKLKEKFQFKNNLRIIKKKTLIRETGKFLDHTTSPWRILSHKKLQIKIMIFLLNKTSLIKRKKIKSCQNNLS